MFLRNLKLCHLVLEEWSDHFLMSIPTDPDEFLKRRAETPFSFFTDRSLTQDQLL